MSKIGPRHVFQSSNTEARRGRSRVVEKSHDFVSNTSNREALRARFGAVSLKTHDYLGFAFDTNERASDYFLEKICLDYSEKKLCHVDFTAQLLSYFMNGSEKHSGVQSQSEQNENEDSENESDESGSDSVNDGRAHVSESAMNESDRDSDSGAPVPMNESKIEPLVFPQFVYGFAPDDNSEQKQRAYTREDGYCFWRVMYQIACRDEAVEKWPLENAKVNFVKSSKLPEKTVKSLAAKFHGRGLNGPAFKALIAGELKKLNEQELLEYESSCGVEKEKWIRLLEHNLPSDDEAAADVLLTEALIERHSAKVALKEYTASLNPKRGKSKGDFAIAQTVLDEYSTVESELELASIDVCKIEGFKVVNEFDLARLSLTDYRNMHPKWRGEVNYASSLSYEEKVQYDLLMAEYLSLADDVEQKRRDVIAAVSLSADVGKDKKESVLAELIKAVGQRDLLQSNCPKFSDAMMLIGVVEVVEILSDGVCKLLPRDCPVVVNFLERRQHLTVFRQQHQRLCGQRNHSIALTTDEISEYQRLVDEVEKSRQAVMQSADLVSVPSVESMKKAVSDLRKLQKKSPGKRTDIEEHQYCVLLARAVLADSVVERMLVGDDRVDYATGVCYVTEPQLTMTATLQRFETVISYLRNGCGSLPGMKVCYHCIIVIFVVQVEFANSTFFSFPYLLVEAWGRFPEDLANMRNRAFDLGEMGYGLVHATLLVQINQWVLSPGDSSSAAYKEVRFDVIGPSTVNHLLFHTSNVLYKDLREIVLMHPGSYFRHFENHYAVVKSKLREEEDFLQLFGALASNVASAIIEADGFIRSNYSDRMSMLDGWKMFLNGSVTVRAPNYDFSGDTPMPAVAPKFSPLKGSLDEDAVGGGDSPPKADLSDAMEDSFDDGADMAMAVRD